MVWASFDSIRAVESRAASIAVRVDAARLKSMAAPTKPNSGRAASASIGATLASRFRKKRASNIAVPLSLWNLSGSSPLLFVFYEYRLQALRLRERGRLDFLQICRELPAIAEC